MDIEKIDDEIGFEDAKNDGFIGFASKYLQQCWNETELINEADLDLYRKLVRQDSKYGVTELLQLDRCVSLTTRLDLIQVLFNELHQLIPHLSFC